VEGSETGGAYTVRGGTEDNPNRDSFESYTRISHMDMTLRML
jgi:hypothetical protein